MARRATQAEQIKNYLWERFGQWVPLPELLPFAAQYSARIYELRRELRAKGYEIFNKTERQGDGAIHSWFKLDYRKALDITPAKPKAIQKAAPIADGDWFEREHGPRPSDKPKESAADLPLFALASQ